MSYERDAWDTTGDMGNGIEGQHLKCAKGRWLLDDNSIETGEAGIKICVIMDSATVGEILWENQKIVDRNIGRISDGFVPPKQIKQGWNPYTAFQAIRADENLGDLLTFTSSSWGGRYAFQSLVNPFRLKQRSQFPICTLSTKERGDANGNIDPVFKIVSWTARENFTELLPPTTNYLPSPEEKISAPGAITKSHVTELIDDNIPF